MPRSRNVWSVLRSHAPSDATTLLTTGEGRRLSYGEFDAMVGRFANAMAGAGVAPGDRVAIQAPKSVETLAATLAAMRSGAVALPLNTGYTPAEIEYFLQDAAPALFVADSAAPPELERVAERAGTRLQSLGADGRGSLAEAAASAPSAFTDHPADGGDLAAILYTSGTTGRSKGAMLTHDNLVSNAEVLVEFWRFTGSDVLLHALPIFHTHGLFVATNTAMMAGASMIFLNGFDAAEVVGHLPAATAMMGVPTFYSRLLGRSEFTRDRVGHMRLFVSGSAPLSAEVHREFSERTGHAILERYGMTETNMSTSNPYDGERRPGTVGFPLPGVSLRIVDQVSGRAVPDGEVGVIEVRGPNVCSGYWRKPDKTAEAFRADGFFITGDLARRDAEGYVHIVGRDKDLIITGGLNVYPAEVEAVLDELPGVAESAVIGVPHADFGEGVTAVVAPRPGADLDEGAIMAALEARLAAFKRPKRILFVDALPRNTMGKVQKAALRQENQSLYATG